MKTSMLLAIFAIAGIVAFAGLAAATGTDAGILNINDDRGRGNGMMSQNGGCHGSSGQSAQYRYDGSCPGVCQAELRNNYSWSFGEGNMTCGGIEHQYEGDGPGTCDNCQDWNYSWNWDHNYCGQ